MEWHYLKKQKTRRKIGGVLFTKEPGIIPELIRFTNSKIHILSKRRQAVLLVLNAHASTILSNQCAITSVILKIVAINETAVFNGHPIEATPVKEFESEVHKHQDICERSIEKFKCSIAPTILYADTYTKEELMHIFPSIGQYVKGNVGLIFMEHIKHHRIVEHPTIYNYLEVIKDDTLQPKARRLLVMLAQIGFLHNDFHLNNIVVTEPFYGSNPALLLIDFGRTSSIQPSEVDVFQKKVEAYDASKDDALKKEILTFLYRLEYKGYNPDDYPESYGWFKGDIADEVDVTAPMLLNDEQKKQCVIFQKIPYKTREFLKRNGHLLKDYPELQNNRQIVLYAVASFGYALEYASPALRNDKEVVMTAVNQNGLALQYASPTMRADIDVLRIAIRHPRALQYAVHPDREIVLTVVKKDGLSLAYVPGVTDKDILLTAVTQNALALHYVDKDKQDKEIVMTAVNKNGMVLEYASDAFRDDKEVVMEAVRQNGTALKYASDVLRADEEVVLTAVLQNGRAIHHTTLNRNPKIILYASVNGHHATADEIKMVMPFAATYVPSEEDTDLVEYFIDRSKRPKMMKTVEAFNTRYEREIREELRRKEQTPFRISESVERLSECKRGNCTISGGKTKKNKKVMYGSKTRRARTKSFRFRTSS